MTLSENVQLNHPYEKLTPDFVLDAIEAKGFLTDARILTLNSYENRVYQVGIEGSSPLIAKFYRPGRWTHAQILEEHQFTQALKDLDISVVPPLFDTSGNSIFEYQDFLFSLYPRQGGHAPNLDDFDTLLSIGRAMGRTHALGQAQVFKHRPTLSIETFATDSYNFLLKNESIPRSLLPAYTTLGADLIQRCTSILNA